MCLKFIFSCWIYTFVIVKCHSLTHVTTFLLKSILPVSGIAAPALLQLLFEYYKCMYPFTFNLYFYFFFLSSQ